MKCKDKRDKKKLEKFLANLKDPKIKFPAGYLEYHRNKIECIEWMIASYENKTAAKPIEYLESILNPDKETKDLKHFEEAKFLYHWVYYKRITGF